MDFIHRGFSFQRRLDFRIIGVAFLDGRVHGKCRILCKVDPGIRIHAERI